MFKVIQAIESEFKYCITSQENVALKSLHLGWNGFSDDGAKALAEALRTCPLAYLDLKANRIGPEGFLALIKVLGHNDDLKELKVSRAIARPDK